MSTRDVAVECYRYNGGRITYLWPEDLSKSGLEEICPFSVLALTLLISIA